MLLPLYATTEVSGSTFWYFSPKKSKLAELKFHINR